MDNRKNERLKTAAVILGAIVIAVLSFFAVLNRRYIQVGSNERIFVFDQWSGKYVMPTYKNTKH